MRQFWVTVPGGVEHVRIRARTLHETSNWLVLPSCSNTFNTVKRTAVVAEAANYVAALTPFAAKCSGTRPTDVIFRMDSGETRTIVCSSGVQQGDPMGPAKFCVALRPGLKVSGKRSGEKEWKPSLTWTMSLSPLWGLWPSPSSGET